LTYPPPCTISLSDRGSTMTDNADKGRTIATDSEFRTNDDTKLSTILPDLSAPMDEATKATIRANAQIASDFLKAISHEGRLMILCALAHGERSVTDIERLLSSRQAAVSQQLSRLRHEGLVTARRDGKQIFYRLKDERARKIVEQVYELFCT